MPSNLSKDALGGRDPFSLEWTLEIEPFSTFSYSIMRNNILKLSLSDKFESMRDSIIYMKPPKEPKLDQINEI